ncbi:helix-turn-helix domain-containing protein [Nocardia sp. NPDC059240]|uniref:helix-turn-helix domain-containing protein n=1 Tax=Nocardia sp. NPDC059240 TaxID=3346786 RepID=UPI0036B7C3F0
MNHRDQGREALAERIQQLRGEHPELSLRAIGDRAQVSHTTVARALSTADKLPSWPSIAAIARVLGGAGSDVEALWLWASTGTPPESGPNSDDAVTLAEATASRRPRWFIPTCVAVAVTMMILAIVHSAVPPQSHADRWLGNVAQTVFATAATLAFAVNARRAHAPERRWLLVACLASGCWTAAMVCWTVVHEIGGDHDRGTTLAEVGFHGYSLLMLTALWLRLRPALGRAPRGDTLRTVALAAVAALSIPALIWILAALLHTNPADPPDNTAIRLTYLYPIADAAMLALALLTDAHGRWSTQSRLLATAFVAHTAAAILATIDIAADASTDLVASSELGFTSFTALLALAAITPADHHTPSPRLHHRIARGLQATGLIAVAIYILAPATGHLPAAINSGIAAGIALLLVVALLASFYHPTRNPRPLP